MLAAYDNKYIFSCSDICGLIGYFELGSRSGTDTHLTLGFALLREDGRSQKGAI